jgi:hypothetical protein
MFVRIGIAAVLLPAAVLAQFSGLSTTSDGSSLYFVSTLRLKGTAEPLNGKVFVALNGGVALYRARKRASPPAGAPSCAVGGFRNYVRAETATDGVVALFYRSDSVGGCSFPPFALSTQLRTPAREITVVSDIARISPGGRYAIIYSPVTARLYNGIGVLSSIWKQAPEYPSSFPRLPSRLRCSYQPQGAGSSPTAAPRWSRSQMAVTS